MDSASLQLFMQSHPISIIIQLLTFGYSLPAFIPKELVVRGMVYNVKHKTYYFHLICPNCVKHSPIMR